MTSIQLNCSGHQLDTVVLIFLLVENLVYVFFSRRGSLGLIITLCDCWWAVVGRVPWNSESLSSSLALSLVASFGDISIQVGFRAK